MSNQRLASVIVIVHCRLHQFYTAAVECYNNDVAYQQGNIITELFLSYFYIEILRYQHQFKSSNRALLVSYFLLLGTGFVDKVVKRTFSLQIRRNGDY